MKFRLRPGFKLFHTHDEAIEYAYGNRSISPRAKEGDEITLTLSEIASLRQQNSLGKLEPIDAEAIAYFGNTKAVPSRLHTHPLDYVPPAVERL